MPVAMNEEQRTYLDNYLRSIPIADREKYVSFSAGYFCAAEENANTCSELVDQSCLWLWLSAKAHQ